MLTEEQKNKMTLLTSHFKSISRKGETVVVITDESVSKVIAHRSSSQKSHVVRVQLGGSLILIYSPSGQGVVDRSFSQLKSYNRYCIVIYQNANPTYFGPVYFSYTKDKKTRGEKDFKSGGSDVYVFSDLSAQQILNGAKEMEAFHKRRGVRLS